MFSFCILSSIGAGLTFLSSHHPPLGNSSRPKSRLPPIFFRYLSNPRCWLPSGPFSYDRNSVLVDLKPVASRGWAQHAPFPLVFPSRFFLNIVTFSPLRFPLCYKFENSTSLASLPRPIESALPLKPRFFLSRKPDFGPMELSLTNLFGRLIQNVSPPDTLNSLLNFSHTPNDQLRKARFPNPVPSPLV